MGALPRRRDRLGARRVPGGPALAGGVTCPQETPTMCGIAGIIYKNGNGAHRIGRDITSMLQSMKHRGPDSTGFALYHAPATELTVRINLADSSTPRDLDFTDNVRRRRHEVEARLRAAGATIKATEDVNEYTFSATVAYNGELKTLADHVESVSHTE